MNYQIGSLPKPVWESQLLTGNSQILLTRLRFAL